MPGKFAAKRYAKALFELGAGKLEKWNGDLARVESAVADPEVAAFLGAPRVSLKDKVGLLSRTLADVSPEVLNLTYLLIKEGEVNKLGAVAQGFQKLVDEAAGIERGTVTTAVPLSEAEVQDIGRRVGAAIKKKVVLSGQTNPALLGGFQARVAGKLLDGSTSTALSALKNKLS